MGAVALREEGQSLTIDGTEAIADLCSEMRFLDREWLRIVLLNAKQQLIKVATVSQGSVNESLAHPREVFKPAIVLSAYSFIMVPNLCVGTHKLCYVKHRIMFGVIETTPVCESFYRARVTSPARKSLPLRVRIRRIRCRVLLTEDSGQGVRRPSVPAASHISQRHRASQSKALGRSKAPGRKRPVIRRRDFPTRSPDWQQYKFGTSPGERRAGAVPATHQVIYRK